MMPHISDEFAALMSRVLGSGADAQDAMRELIDHYGEHILRVVRYRLHKKMRSKFDSDDFVQAVWASFFAMPLDQLHFEGPEDLASFLMQVARNKVVDAVRQRLQSEGYDVNRERSLDGSQAPASDDLAGHEPTASQVAMAREEWERYLGQQPAQHRQVVSALHQGRTVEEIADELGVSERTVYRVVRDMQSGLDS